jgi:uncharacterized protein YbbC (DUF1343 family)
MQNIKLATGLVVILLAFQCSSQSPVTSPKPASKTTTATALKVGAEQFELYLPKLRGKNVGLVINHSAMVGNSHLADTLRARGVNIKKVFAPEHGFRGSAADGETVKDGIDTKTGLPIVSLYGANKKPKPEQIADLDVLIFDIQDVGVRFYTFISTLHYVMEAAAENGKKVIVFDRPNPNGSYIDGPILDPSVKSFIGMHPIPIVHGLTVGELAMMINGEGWLDKNVKCDLEVIKLQGWTHNDSYSPPLRPSPNLPNDQAIRLYPTLGLFEGTVISMGRGTQIPFLIIGNPEFKDFPFQFTPEDIPGMANNPPHKGKVCYGLDLREVATPKKIQLQYVLDFYKKYSDKEKFFTKSFNLLAGNTVLQQQIKDGLTEEQIRATWKDGLTKYGEIRKKYLIYE